MARFVDLFDATQPQSSVAALNERACLAGWSVLNAEQGLDIKDGAHSVVISGVTWSKPDLVLLDELAELNTEGIRVWFFNPDCVFPDERESSRKPQGWCKLLRWRNTLVDS